MHRTTPATNVPCPSYGRIVCVWFALRVGQVFQVVEGSPHPLQPRMGAALVGDHLVRVRVQAGWGPGIELVALVPEQSRVGDVDGDSRSRASGGDGGIGLGSVVHLLRVGRRTRTPFPGHGDDVIGGGVAGTEHPVDAVERVQYSEALRKAQDDDSVDHRLDRGGAFRSVRYRLERSAWARPGCPGPARDTARGRGSGLRRTCTRPRPPRSRLRCRCRRWRLPSWPSPTASAAPFLLNYVDYVHGLVANLRLQAGRPAWHGWLCWRGWLSSALIGTFGTVTRSSSRTRCGGCCRLCPVGPLITPSSHKAPQCGAGPGYPDGVIRSAV